MRWLVEIRLADVDRLTLVLRATKAYLRAVSTLRWCSLSATLAAALALVAVSSGANKPPTHAVKIPSPSAGNVTLTHFVLTARTAKANKTAPTYKLANAASLGSSYYVADSVKKGKSKGHTTYDVTVAVLKGSASKLVNRAKTTAGSGLVLNITGFYAVGKIQSVPNVVGPNNPLPFPCNGSAPASTWGEAGLPGLTGQKAFAFGCNVGNDQPGDLGVATILGSSYCNLGVERFQGELMEIIDTFGCTFPVTNFALTVTGGTINNQLFHPPFTCSFSGATETCNASQPAPAGFQIIVNIATSGPIAPGTRILLKANGDFFNTFVSRP